MWDGRNPCSIYQQVHLKNTKFKKQKKEIEKKKKKGDTQANEEKSVSPLPLILIPTKEQTTAKFEYKMIKMRECEIVKQCSIYQQIHLKNTKFGKLLFLLMLIYYKWSYIRTIQTSS